MTETVDSRTGGRKKKNRVYQRQARAQHGAVGRGHSGPRVPPLPQILDQGAACAILVWREDTCSSAQLDSNNSSAESGVW